MAADSKGQASNKHEITVHARDYDGFLALLKWTIVAVAIITAIVIYIISN